METQEVWTMVKQNMTYKSHSKIISVGFQDASVILPLSQQSQTTVMEMGLCVHIAKGQLHLDIKEEKIMGSEGDE